MSVKNIGLYKRVLEARSSTKDAVIDGTFQRINIPRFAISTKYQTKTLFTRTATSVNKCQQVSAVADYDPFCAKSVVTCQKSVIRD